MRKRLPMPLIMVVFSILWAAQAGAEMKMSGNPAGEIRLEASNEKLSDLLGELSARYNVQYRTAIQLDQRITGTYSGSLKSVLSRLLVGYNYVIKYPGDQFEIMIVGLENEKSGAPGNVKTRPASAAPVRQYTTRPTSNMLQGDNLRK